MTKKFRLFNYRYNIVVKKNYVGAGYTLLKPLAGEDWLRGGDLRDGRWTALPSVLKDIFCREFSVGRFA